MVGKGLGDREEKGSRNIYVSRVWMDDRQTYKNLKRLSRPLLVGDIA